jgi:hypothetical protein
VYLHISSGPSSFGTLKTTKTAVTTWQGHDDNERDPRGLAGCGPKIVDS